MIGKKHPLHKTIKRGVSHEGRDCFFVSYAKRNRALVDDFMCRLQEVLGPSKAYEYHFWMDKNLEIGEDWDVQIQKSLDRCDLGILLVSRSFLNSKYINEVELPLFVKNKSKPCVPVLIQPIDFELHDLKGLEKKQIFMLDHKIFKNQGLIVSVKGREEMILC